MNIKEKWNEILQKIKIDCQMSDVSFNTWLSPLSVAYFDDNTVKLLVPSGKMGKMSIDYIGDKYIIPIKAAIAQIMDKDYDVVLVSPDDSDSEPAKAPSVDVSSVGLNPRYTFDTFVVGNNNKFAHAAALAVSESPGTVHNPLFLYGGVGLGKTHLMHSIANFIKTYHKNMTILYVTSEQFTNEVIDAIRSANSSAIAKFRDKYRNIDVLLIDDIQFVIGKESTQEEFFHTFNALHEADKQIVISSDRPPKDMNILEERIRSRFLGGLMVDIQSPDFETRVAILQKKQELDGIYVKQEAIDYIAENVTSNIRELEGALNRVRAVAKMEGREADAELAKMALKDIITPKEAKIISPDLIIKKVASFYSINPDDITGNKRNNKIAYPRQIAMYLIREMTNTNLQGIGELLGKDHTTVMYGIKKIENSVGNDPSLENDINELKKIITE